MTGRPLLFSLVKFVLLYFAVAGLVVAGMLAFFWLLDHWETCRVRWQARRLQREVDAHLEEVSR